MPRDLPTFLVELALQSHRQSSTNGTASRTALRITHGAKKSINGSSSRSLNEEGDAVALMTGAIISRLRTSNNLSAHRLTEDLVASPLVSHARSVMFGTLLHSMTTAAVAPLQMEKDEALDVQPVGHYALYQTHADVADVSEAPAHLTDVPISLRASPCPIRLMGGRQRERTVLQRSDTQRRSLTSELGSTRSPAFPLRQMNISDIPLVESAVTGQAPPSLVTVNARHSRLWRRLDAAWRRAAGADDTVSPSVSILPALAIPKEDSARAAFQQALQLTSSPDDSDVLTAYVVQQYERILKASVGSVGVPVSDAAALRADQEILTFCCLCSETCVALRSIQTSSISSPLRASEAMLVVATCSMSLLRCAETHLKGNVKQKLGHQLASPQAFLSDDAGRSSPLRPLLSTHSYRAAHYLSQTLVELHHRNTSEEGSDASKAALPSATPCLIPLWVKERLCGVQAAASAVLWDCRLCAESYSPTPLAPWHLPLYLLYLLANRGSASRRTMNDSAVEEAGGMERRAVRLLMEGLTTELDEKSVAVQQQVLREMRDALGLSCAAHVSHPFLCRLLSELPPKWALQLLTGVTLPHHTVSGASAHGPILSAKARDALVATIQPLFCNAASGACKPRASDPLSSEMMVRPCGTSTPAAATLLSSLWVVMGEKEEMLSIARRVLMDLCTTEDRREGEAERQERLCTLLRGLLFSIPDRSARMLVVRGLLTDVYLCLSSTVQRSSEPRWPAVELFHNKESCRTSPPSFAVSVGMIQAAGVLIESLLVNASGEGAATEQRRLLDAITNLLAANTCAYEHYQQQQQQCIYRCVAEWFLRNPEVYLTDLARHRTHGATPSNACALQLVSWFEHESLRLSRSRAQHPSYNSTVTSARNGASLPLQWCTWASTLLSRLCGSVTSVLALTEIMATSGGSSPAVRDVHQMQMAVSAALRCGYSAGDVCARLAHLSMVAFTGNKRSASPVAGLLQLHPGWDLSHRIATPGRPASVLPCDDSGTMDSGAQPLFRLYVPQQQEGLLQVLPPSCPSELSPAQQEELVLALRTFTQARRIHDAVALFYAHERKGRRLTLAEVELFADLARRAPLPFLVRLLKYVPPPITSLRLAISLTAGAWRSYQRTLATYSNAQRRSTRSSEKQQQQQHQRHGDQVDGQQLWQMRRTVEECWWASLVVVRRALDLLPMAPHNAEGSSSAQQTMRLLSTLLRLVDARPNWMFASALYVMLQEGLTDEENSVVELAAEWDSAGVQSAQLLAWLMEQKTIRSRIGGLLSSSVISIEELRRTVDFCRQHGDTEIVVQAYARFAAEHMRRATPSATPSEDTKDTSARRDNSPSKSSSAGVRWNAVPLLPLELYSNLLRQCSLQTLGTSGIADPAAFPLSGRHGAATEEYGTNIPFPAANVVEHEDGEVGNYIAELMNVRASMEDGRPVVSNSGASAARRDHYQERADVKAFSSPTRSSSSYTEHCITIGESMLPSLSAALKAVLTADPGLTPLVRVLHDGLRRCRLSLMQSGRDSLEDRSVFQNLYEPAEADSASETGADVLACLLASLFQMETVSLSTCSGILSMGDEYGMLPSPVVENGVAGGRNARPAFTCAMPLDAASWRLLQHAGALLAYTTLYTTDLYALAYHLLWVSSAQQQEVVTGATACVQVLLSTLEALDAWMATYAAQRQRTNGSGDLLAADASSQISAGEGICAESVRMTREELRGGPLTLLRQFLRTLEVSRSNALAAPHSVESVHTQRILMALQHRVDVFAQCSPTSTWMERLCTTRLTSSSNSELGSVPLVQQLLLCNTPAYYQGSLRFMRGVIGSVNPLLDDDDCGSQLVYALHCLCACGEAPQRVVAHLAAIDTTLQRLSAVYTCLFTYLQTRRADDEGASIPFDASNHPVDAQLLHLLRRASASAVQAAVLLDEVIAHWNALHLRVALGLLEGEGREGTSTTVNAQLAADTFVAHLQGEWRRLLRAFKELHLSIWWTLLIPRLETSNTAATLHAFWEEEDVRAAQLYTMLHLQHRELIITPEEVRATEKCQQALLRPTLSAAAHHTTSATSMGTQLYTVDWEALLAEANTVEGDGSSEAKEEPRRRRELEHVLLHSLVTSTSMAPAAPLRTAYYDVPVGEFMGTAQMALSIVHGAQAALLWRFLLRVLEEPPHLDAVLRDSSSEMMSGHGLAYRVPRSLWTLLQKWKEKPQSTDGAPRRREWRAQEVLNAVLQSNHTLVLRGVLAHPLLRLYQAGALVAEGEEEGSGAGVSWMTAMVSYGMNDSVQDTAAHSARAAAGPLANTYWALRTQSPPFSSGTGLYTPSLCRQVVPALVLATLRDTSLVEGTPSSSQQRQMREDVLRILTEHLGYVAPEAWYVARLWARHTPYPLTLSGEGVRIAKLRPVNNGKGMETTTDVVKIAAVGRHYAEGTPSISPADVCQLVRLRSVFVACGPWPPAVALPLLHSAVRKQEALTNAAASVADPQYGVGTVDLPFPEAASLYEYVRSGIEVKETATDGAASATQQVTVEDKSVENWRHVRHPMARSLLRCVAGKHMMTPFGEGGSAADEEVRRRTIAVRQENSVSDSSRANTSAAMEDSTVSVRESFRVLTSIPTQSGERRHSVTALPAAVSLSAVQLVSCSQTEFRNKRASPSDRSIGTERQDKVLTSPPLQQWLTQLATAPSVFDLASLMDGARWMKYIVRLPFAASARLVCSLWQLLLMRMLELDAVRCTTHAKSKKTSSDEAALNDPHDGNAASRVHAALFVVATYLTSVSTAAANDDDGAAGTRRSRASGLPTIEQDGNATQSARQLLCEVQHAIACSWVSTMLEEHWVVTYETEGSNHGRTMYTALLSLWDSLSVLSVTASSNNNRQEVGEHIPRSLLGSLRDAVRPTCAQLRHTLQEPQALLPSKIAVDEKEVLLQFQDCIRALLTAEACTSNWRERRMSCLPPVPPLREDAAQSAAVATAANVCMDWPSSPAVLWEAMVAASYVRASSHLPSPSAAVTVRLHHPHWLLTLLLVWRSHHLPGRSTRSAEGRQLCDSLLDALTHEMCSSGWRNICMSLVGSSTEGVPDARSGKAIAFPLVEWTLMDLWHLVDAYSQQGSVQLSFSSPCVNSQNGMKATADPMDAHAATSYIPHCSESKVAPGVSLVMAEFFDLLSSMDSHLQHERHRPRRGTSVTASSQVLTLRSVLRRLRPRLFAHGSEERGPVGVWSLYLPMSPSFEPTHSGTGARTPLYAPQHSKWHAYLHVVHLCTSGLLDRSAMRRGRRAGPSGDAITVVCERLTRLVHLQKRLLSSEATVRRPSSRPSGMHVSSLPWPLSTADAERILCWQLRRLHELQTYVSPQGWTLQRQQQWQRAQRDVRCSVDAIAQLAMPSSSAVERGVRRAGREENEQSTRPVPGRAHAVEAAMAACFYPHIEHRFLERMAATETAGGPATVTSGTDATTAAPRGEGEVQTVFSRAGTLLPRSAAAAKGSSSFAVLPSDAASVVCSSISLVLLRNPEASIPRDDPVQADVRLLHSVLSREWRAMRERERASTPALLLRFLESRESRAQRHGQGGGALSEDGEVERALARVLMQLVSCADISSHPSAAVKSGLELYLLMQLRSASPRAIHGEPQSCVTDAVMALVLRALEEECAATGEEQNLSIIGLALDVLGNFLGHQQAVPLSSQAVALLGAIYWHLVMKQSRERRQSEQLKGITAASEDVPCTTRLLWRVLHALRDLSELDLARVRLMWCDYDVYLTSAASPRAVVSCGNVVAQLYEGAVQQLSNSTSSSAISSLVNDGFLAAAVRLRTWWAAEASSIVKGSPRGVVCQLVLEDVLCRMLHLLHGERNGDGSAPVSRRFSSRSSRLHGAATYAQYRAVRDTCFPLPLSTPASTILTGDAHTEDMGLMNALEDYDVATLSMELSVASALLPNEEAGSALDMLDAVRAAPLQSLLARFVEVQDGVGNRRSGRAYCQTRGAQALESTNSSPSAVRTVVWPLSATADIALYLLRCMKQQQTLNKNEAPRAFGSAAVNSVPRVDWQSVLLPLRALQRTQGSRSTGIPAELALVCQSYGLKACLMHHEKESSGMGSSPQAVLDLVPVYYSTLHLLHQSGCLLHLPVRTLVQELLLPLLLREEKHSRRHRSNSPSEKDADEEEERKRRNRVELLCRIARQLPQHPMLSVVQEALNMNCTSPTYTAMAQMERPVTDRGTSNLCGWPAALVLLKVLCQLDGLLTCSAAPGVIVPPTNRTAIASAQETMTLMFAKRYAAVLATQRGQDSTAYLSFVLLACPYMGVWREEMAPALARVSPSVREEADEDPSERTGNRGGSMVQASTQNAASASLWPELHHMIAVCAPPAAVGAVVALFHRPQPARVSSWTPGFAPTVGSCNLSCAPAEVEIPMVVITAVTEWEAVVLKQLHSLLRK